jgi:hypothetical protein
MGGREGLFISILSGRLSIIPCIIGCFCLGIIRIGGYLPENNIRMPVAKNSVAHSHKSVIIVKPKTLRGFESNLRLTKMTKKLRVRNMVAGIKLKSPDNLKAMPGIPNLLFNKRMIYDSLLANINRRCSRLRINNITAPDTPVN